MTDNYGGSSNLLNNAKNTRFHHETECFFSNISNKADSFSFVTCIIIVKEQ